MARKSDPVTRLKRELADLDAEIAGLEAQGRDAERALAEARRTMRTSSLDEGLAAIRQNRESVTDLGEVLDAKRDLRRAKAAEVAAAEADAAVDQLAHLRAERSAAIAETVEAAKAFKAALDRLGAARQAVAAHVGGLVPVEYFTTLAEVDPARLADWAARGKAGFDFRTVSGPEDPDSWGERMDRPADHQAVVAGVQQFKQRYQERAEARLAAPASGDAPASETAA
jgi:multidrug efflux pump subunit AcrA (membrane-fusion protein)